MTPRRAVATARPNAYVLPTSPRPPRDSPRFRRAGAGRAHVPAWPASSTRTSPQLPSPGRPGSGRCSGPRSPDSRSACGSCGRRFRPAAFSSTPCALPPRTSRSERRVEWPGTGSSFQTRQDSQLNFEFIPYFLKLP